MTAHLVFAHPNLNSFNGLLRNAAIDTLHQHGWTVTVSNLYQMDFKAALNEGDFTSLHQADFFDPQLEQQAAARTNTFSPDIQHEHACLVAADLLIFQFPLWWYSMPALMKGYIDRVFAMGWAYGGGQALAGKRVLISTTTGAPELTWTPEKRGTIRDIFKHLFVGTFSLCGLEPTEPFIAYGAKRMTDHDRQHTLDRFREHLTALV